MTYVVSNEGLISDPFALQEFQQIQATLKRIEEALNKIGDPEDPDNGGGGGNNPPTETPEVIGQRWLTGPWVLGLDGAGIPVKPFYSVVKPPEWDSDQHNFWCNGLDNAVMLEAYPNTTVRLTGIRVGARNRRILALYNRGAGDLKIVNSATTESSAQYCFSWGTSGDIGEEIIIPNGIVVWLLYDARTQRWKLFAIPPVGSDNLPPSIGSSAFVFPPRFMWWASRITDVASTIAHTMQTTPGFTTASGITYKDQYGYGATRETGAAVGNMTGVEGGSGSAILPEFDPMWEVWIRTHTNISAIRLWAVLSDTAMSSSDSIGGGGTADGFGFRYSTDAGDGGWVGVSRDGTTQSVTSTLAAIAANTDYLLRMRKEGSSLYFSVNGGAEVAHTTNLPADGSVMRWRLTVETRDAGGGAGAIRRITYRSEWGKFGHMPTGLANTYPP